MPHGTHHASPWTGRRPATATLRPATAALVTIALALLLLPGGAPAHAGTNSGTNGCLKGYNYADPATDYLFASSDALASDCAWVHVDIRNNGSVSGGFPYSWCSGTALGSADGSWYVSRSVTLGSGQWQTPCSNHIGAPEPHMIHKWGALYFDIR